MDSRLSGDGCDLASVSGVSCVWAEGSTPSTSTKEVRSEEDNISVIKLNNIIMKTFETFDELSNYEFGMDYDQLGPNEQQWVRDELF